MDSFNIVVGSVDPQTGITEAFAKDSSLYKHLYTNITQQKQSHGDLGITITRQKGFFFFLG